MRALQTHTRPSLDRAVLGSDVLGFFFFNDTATTEIYTLSLHDALPIYAKVRRGRRRPKPSPTQDSTPSSRVPRSERSEEHTSELQSPCNLVCRLLLEKKTREAVRISVRSAGFSAVATICRMSAAGC